MGFGIWDSCLETLTQVLVAGLMKFVDMVVKVGANCPSPTARH